MKFPLPATASSSWGEGRVRGVSSCTAARVAPERAPGFAHKLPSANKVGRLHIKRKPRASGAFLRCLAKRHGAGRCPALRSADSLPRTYRVFGLRSADRASMLKKAHAASSFEGRTRRGLELAGVAELADAADLDSAGQVGNPGPRVGSNPTISTSDLVLRRGQTFFREQ
jgi:hypothetical protein